MGTIAALADGKANPLTEKPSRLLAATAMCVLAAACSQIPRDSDPKSPSNEESFPAVAPAVSAPVVQPASTVGVARAPAAVAAPAQTAAASLPPEARPTPSVVPVPPVAKPQATKDLEPAHTIDLARPADDLWERIRSGFAMADLESPLVAVRERWYASQPEYLKRMVERSKLYLYYIVE